MTIAEALTLLLMIAKAFPNLVPVMKDVITSMRLELSGEEMTDEQKAEVAALFDKTDAELEKACLERLALGNQE
jgi:hypothetical protein